MSSMIATREAYGKKLAALGHQHQNICVLDADLSCSTKTGVFAKEFPKRFFNVGVAEQDLMGMASGLASTGKKVFVSTFAIFAAGRAWEPVRQSIAYPNMDVKICATHAGLTVGEDGASHQMIEDIALMRVIPQMQVFVPSDAIETEKILEYFANEYHGPAYLRLSRAKAPVVFDDNYQFKPGKGHWLVKGSKLCLFTAGFMLSIALEAAKELEKLGISTSVVNLASVKPIDKELIIECARQHDHLACIEEHNVMAGLGSAVSEVLIQNHPKKMLLLGLQDEFGQSGSYQDVLAHYGLDSAGLVKTLSHYVA